MFLYYNIYKIAAGNLAIAAGNLAIAGGNLAIAEGSPDTTVSNHENY